MGGGGGAYCFLEFNGGKALSHIPSRTSSAQKNEEFWSVRCDSLGVH